MAPAFIDRSRPEAKSFESARTRPVRGKDRASRSGQGAADRDRGRLEALAREDRKAASTYVRSDYFGTAEHRALAEQLKRLLANEPVLGAPAADPSHVLVVRKGVSGIKDDLDRALPIAELDFGGMGSAWLQNFRRTQAETLAWYDPLKELPVGDSLMLTYGDIVALAGDYFENPDELAAELTPSVVRAIKGVTPRSPGTFILSTHRGWFEYLALANKNVDHFSPRNWYRYAIHHAEALRLALARRYEQALVRNAFADHFLSDAFASGHHRVPRASLLGIKKGFFDAKPMHDEENTRGLWVQDLGGRVWRAYGDSHLADNPVHVTLTALAIGTSLERVHRAYRLEGADAARLGSALDGGLGTVDAEKVVPGSFANPGDLPEWMGAIAGLPDIRTCLPVPLPWHPNPAPGEHLCNYEPLFTPGPGDKPRRRSGTPNFAAYFTGSR
jgi:hypothetical protein